MRSITPSSISTATGVMARAVISATVSPAVVGRIVNRQHRFDHFRLAHQPHHHFRDQRHRAFRSRQHSGQVISGQIGFFAAGDDDRPVRKHRLEAEHVIGRHPVGERVRTAGILRDVAADGAGALAGRIRRIEVSLTLHRQRNVQVHYSRLHHGALVFEIDFENPVHSREPDHHAALARNRPAAQSRSRAAADHRDCVLVGQFHDRNHVLRRPWKDHQVRPPLIDAAVILV